LNLVVLLPILLGATLLADGEEDPSVAISAVQPVCSCDENVNIRIENHSPTAVWVTVAVETKPRVSGTMEADDEWFVFDEDVFNEPSSAIVAARIEPASSLDSIWIPDAKEQGCSLPSGQYRFSVTYCESEAIDNRTRFKTTSFDVLDCAESKGK